MGVGGSLPVRGFNSRMPANPERVISRNSSSNDVAPPTAMPMCRYDPLAKASSLRNPYFPRDVA